MSARTKFRAWEYRKIDEVLLCVDLFLPQSKGDQNPEVTDADKMNRVKKASKHQEKYQADLKKMKTGSRSNVGSQSKKIKTQLRTPSLSPRGRAVSLKDPNKSPEKPNKRDSLKSPEKPDKQEGPIKSFEKADNQNADKKCPDKPRPRSLSLPKKRPSNSSKTVMNRSLSSSLSKENKTLKQISNQGKDMNKVKKGPKNQEKDQADLKKMKTGNKSNVGSQSKKIMPQLRAPSLSPKGRAVSLNDPKKRPEEPDNQNVDKKCPEKPRPRSLSSSKQRPICSTKRSLSPSSMSKQSETLKQIPTLTGSIKQQSPGKSTKNENQDTQANEEELCECCFCPHKCTIFYNLKRHTELLHPGLEQPYRIELENQYKRYKCLFCPAIFQKFDTLRQHSHTHTVFSCEFCCAKRIGRMNLLSHIATAHLDMNKLNGATILDKLLVKEGMKMVTKDSLPYLKEKLEEMNVDNPSRPEDLVMHFYECKICGDMCNGKETFIIHLDQCHKIKWGFKNRSSKEQYFELVYQCSFCHKIFMSHTNVVRHCKKQHTDKMTYHPLLHRYVRLDNGSEETNEKLMSEIDDSMTKENADGGEEINSSTTTTECTLNTTDTSGGVNVLDMDKEDDVCRPEVDETATSMSDAVGNDNVTVMLNTGCKDRLHERLLLSFESSPAENDCLGLKITVGCGGARKVIDKANKKAEEDNNKMKFENFQITLGGNHERSVVPLKDNVKTKPDEGSAQMKANNRDTSNTEITDLETCVLEPVCKGKNQMKTNNRDKSNSEKLALSDLETHVMEPLGAQQSEIEPVQQLGKSCISINSPKALKEAIKAKNDRKRTMEVGKQKHVSRESLLERFERSKHTSKGNQSEPVICDNPASNDNRSEPVVGEKPTSSWQPEDSDQDLPTDFNDDNNTPAESTDKKKKTLRRSPKIVLQKLVDIEDTINMKDLRCLEPKSTSDLVRSDKPDPTFSANDVVQNDDDSMLEEVNENMAAIIAQQVADLSNVVTQMRKKKLIGPKCRRRRNSGRGKSKPVSEMKELKGQEKTQEESSKIEETDKKNGGSMEDENIGDSIATSMLNFGEKDKEVFHDQEIFEDVNKSNEKSETNEDKQVPTTRSKKAKKLKRISVTEKLVDENSKNEEPENVHIANEAELRMEDNIPTMELDKEVEDILENGDKICGKDMNEEHVPTTRSKKTKKLKHVNDKEKTVEKSSTNEDAASVKEQIILESKPISETKFGEKEMEVNKEESHLKEKSVNTSKSKKSKRLNQIKDKEKTIVESSLNEEIVNEDAAIVEEQNIDDSVPTSVPNRGGEEMKENEEESSMKDKQVPTTRSQKSKRLQCVNDKEKTLEKRNRNEDYNQKDAGNVEEENIDDSMSTSVSVEQNKTVNTEENNMKEKQVATTRSKKSKRLKHVNDKEKTIEHMENDKKDEGSVEEKSNDEKVPTSMLRSEKHDKEVENKKENENREESNTKSKKKKLKRIKVIAEPTKQPEENNEKERMEIGSYTMDCQTVQNENEAENFKDKDKQVNDNVIKDQMNQEDAGLGDKNNFMRQIELSTESLDEGTKILSKRPLHFAFHPLVSVMPEDELDGQKKKGRRKKQEADENNKSINSKRKQSPSKKEKLKIKWPSRRQESTRKSPRVQGLTKDNVKDETPNETPSSQVATVQQVERETTIETPSLQLETVEQVVLNNLEINERNSKDEVEGQQLTNETEVAKDNALELNQQCSTDDTDVASEEKHDFSQSTLEKDLELSSSENDTSVMDTTASESVPEMGTTKIDSCDADKLNQGEDNSSREDSSSIHSIDNSSVRKKKRKTRSEDGSNKISKKIKKDSGINTAKENMGVKESYFAEFKTDGKTDVGNDHEKITDEDNKIDSEKNLIIDEKTVNEQSYTESKDTEEAESNSLEEENINCEGSGVEENGGQNEHEVNHILNEIESTNVQKPSKRPVKSHGQKQSLKKLPSRSKRTTSSLSRKQRKEIMKSYNDRLLDGNRDLVSNVKTIQIKNFEENYDETDSSQADPLFTIVTPKGDSREDLRVVDSTNSMKNIKILKLNTDGCFYDKNKSFSVSKQGANEEEFSSKKEASRDIENGKKITLDNILCNVFKLLNGSDDSRYDVDSLLNGIEVSSDTKDCFKINYGNGKKPHGLQKVMQMFSKQKQEYICNFCEEMFDSDKQLKQHQQYGDCVDISAGMISQSNSPLQDRIVESPIEVHPVLTAKSKASVTKDQSIDNDILDQFQDPSKMFECELCGLRYKHMKNLKRHLKTVHKVNPNKSTIKLEDSSKEGSCTNKVSQLRLKIQKLSQSLDAKNLMITSPSSDSSERSVRQFEDVSTKNLVITSPSSHSSVRSDGNSSRNLMSTSPSSKSSERSIGKVVDDMMSEVETIPASSILGSDNGHDDQGMKENEPVISFTAEPLTGAMLNESITETVNTSMLSEDLMSSEVTKCDDQMSVDKKNSVALVSETGLSADETLVEEGQNVNESFGSVDTAMSEILSSSGVEKNVEDVKIAINSLGKSGLSASTPVPIGKTLPNALIVDDIGTSSKISLQGKSSMQISTKLSDSSISSESPVQNLFVKEVLEESQSQVKSQMTSPPSKIMTIGDIRSQYPDCEIFKDCSVLLDCIQLDKKKIRVGGIVLKRVGYRRWRIKRRKHKKDRTQSKDANMSSDLKHSQTDKSEPVINPLRSNDFDIHSPRYEEDYFPMLNNTQDLSKASMEINSSISSMVSQNSDQGSSLKAGKSKLQTIQESPTKNLTDFEKAISKPNSSGRVSSKPEKKKTLERVPSKEDSNSQDGFSFLKKTSEPIPKRNESFFMQSKLVQSIMKKKAKEQEDQLPISSCNLEDIEPFETVLTMKDKPKKSPIKKKKKVAATTEKGPVVKTDHSKEHVAANYAMEEDDFHDERIAKQTDVLDQPQKGSDIQVTISSKGQTNTNEKSRSLSDRFGSLKKTTSSTGSDKNVPIDYKGMKSEEVMKSMFGSLPVKFDKTFRKQPGKDDQKDSSMSLKSPLDTIERTGGKKPVGPSLQELKQTVIVASEVKTPVNKKKHFLNMLRGLMDSPEESHKVTLTSTPKDTGIFSSNQIYKTVVIEKERTSPRKAGNVQRLLKDNDSISSTSSKKNVQPNVTIEFDRCSESSKVSDRSDNLKKKWTSGSTEVTPRKRIRLSRLTSNDNESLHSNDSRTITVSSSKVKPSGRLEQNQNETAGEKVNSIGDPRLRQKEQSLRKNVLLNSATAKPANSEDIVDSAERGKSTRSDAVLPSSGIAVMETDQPLGNPVDTIDNNDQEFSENLTSELEPESKEDLNEHLDNKVGNLNEFDEALSPVSSGSIGDYHSQLSDGEVKEGEKGEESEDERKEESDKEKSDDVSEEESSSSSSEEESSDEDDDDSSESDKDANTSDSDKESEEEPEEELDMFSTKRNNKPVYEYKDDDAISIIVDECETASFLIAHTNEEEERMDAVDAELKDIESRKREEPSSSRPQSRPSSTGPNPDTKITPGPEKFAVPQVPTLIIYPSGFCFPFLRSGKCSHGQKCNFKHRAPTQREIFDACVIEISKISNNLVVNNSKRAFDLYNCLLQTNAGRPPPNTLYQLLKIAEDHWKVESAFSLLEEIKNQFLMNEDICSRYIRLAASNSERFSEPLKKLFDIIKNINRNLVNPDSIWVFIRSFQDLPDKSYLWEVILYAKKYHLRCIESRLQHSLLHESLQNLEKYYTFIERWVLNSEPYLLVQMESPLREQLKTLFQGEGQTHCLNRLEESCRHANIQQQLDESYEASSSAVVQGLDVQLKDSVKTTDNYKALYHKIQSCYHTKNWGLLGETFVELCQQGELDNSYYIDAYSLVFLTNVKKPVVLVDAFNKFMISLSRQYKLESQDDVLARFDYLSLSFIGNRLLYACQENRWWKEGQSIIDILLKYYIPFYIHTESGKQLSSVTAINICLQAGDLETAYHTLLYYDWDKQPPMLLPQLQVEISVLHDLLERLLIAQRPREALKVLGSCFDIIDNNPELKEYFDFIEDLNQLLISALDLGDIHCGCWAFKLHSSAQLTTDLDKRTLRALLTACGENNFITEAKELYKLCKSKAVYPLQSVEAPRTIYLTSTMTIVEIKLELESYLEWVYRTLCEIQLEGNMLELQHFYLRVKIDFIMDPAAFNMPYLCRVPDSENAAYSMVQNILIHDFKMDAKIHFDDGMSSYFIYVLADDVKVYMEKLDAQCLRQGFRVVGF